MMLKRIALAALYIALPLLLIAAIYSSNPGYYGSSGLIPMILGALAYTLLNMQLVLSARPKWLDSTFGLDKIYRFHGLAAVAAILLALVHKLLKDAVFAASLKTTLGNTAFFVFAAAIVLALVFIADTLSRRTKALRGMRDYLQKRKAGSYNVQVFIHNITFAATAVIFVHVMLSYSAQDPLVMAVYILYFGIAAYSYLYHKVISRYILIRRYTISETVKESPSVVTLKLRSEGGKTLRHRPGQFGFIRLFGDKAVTSEEHPFSISSAPGNETVDMTIKSSGDWTLKVLDITPGTRAMLDAPYGRFDPTLFDCSGGAALIAGGIGITPVLSILRHYEKNVPPYKILIFWAVNKEQELIRRAEIEAIEAKVKGFRFIPVVADKSFAGETGYLNERIIAKYIDGEGLDAHKLKFFFCGPPPMWPGVNRALKSMSIKKKMIHRENFSL
jgi:predicted ferric reductase